MEKRTRDIRRRRRQKISLVALVVVGILLWLIPTYLYHDSDSPPPVEPDTGLEEAREPWRVPMADLPAETELESDEARRPDGEREEPAAETEAAASLPALPESDPTLRHAATPLSDHPQWSGWLTHDGLIDRIVVLVDNVAAGDMPGTAVDFLAPDTGFTVIENDGRVLLDPASYRRYDAIAGVADSLDADAAASLYSRFSPLFQQAYGKLGYPAKRFDSTLESALAVIRSAPIREGEIELVRPSVNYRFKDPELENLNAVHKQLLRTGPENTRKIQQFARRLSIALARAGRTAP